MEGEQRRNQILTILQSENQPLSGTELAKRLGVSRQVIVQDIALLRAVNRNILSTNKGYILYHKEDAEKKVKRTVKVCHTSEQIQEELYTIVDNGGSVLDVVVEHEIYGQITADLIIHNRADVDAFVDKVEKHRTKPLNALTDGIHFHTIEADEEEILDRIVNQLREKGFLLG